MNNNLKFLLLVPFMSMCAISCSDEEKNEIENELAKNEQVKDPTKQEEPVKRDTLAYDGKIANHAYVDLGLSVKWATCNVGALNPEDAGYYFSWGETQPKDYYEKDNGIWKNCTAYMLTSLSKVTGEYVFPDIFYGNLTTSIDAAATWGGTWRMPSKEEVEELLENSHVTWTTLNGKYGYKFTGPNGNSIFLPRAGYRLGNTPVINDFGQYWTSSMNIANDYLGAYSLSFRNDIIDIQSGPTGWGMSVRPVSK